MKIYIYHVFLFSKVWLIWRKNKFLEIIPLFVAASCKTMDCKTVLQTVAANASIRSTTKYIKYHRLSNENISWDEGILYPSPH